jgi:hypothetical protein
MFYASSRYKLNFFYFDMLTQRFIRYLPNKLFLFLFLFFIYILNQGRNYNFLLLLFGRFCIKYYVNNFLFYFFMVQAKVA